MNAFAKAFGRRRPTNAGLRPGRGFTFEIVGEGSYQHELTKLTGGKTEAGHALFCQATLVAEPGNPHDPGAVRVDIKGLTVGYLSRQDAREYRNSLGDAAAQPQRCKAKIVGGWMRGGGDEGHFGVKLNLRWPPERA